ncbi:NACHT domain-containing protein [Lysobacter rhizosphaerae]
MPYSLVMPPAHESLSSALNRLSNDQIRQAGQRYTPGIDPQAPNLRIESLFTAIENVACGTSARSRFKSVLDAFSEGWGRAKHCSQHVDAIQALTDDAGAFLSPMMSRLRARDAAAGEEWFSRISSIESELLADLDHWRTEEAKLPPDGESGYSSAHNTVRGNMQAIGRCLAVLRDEKEYIQSSAFKVLSDPLLLVNGEWGTGKTHLMCDVAQDRISRGQPTILVLAKNFQGRVAAEICARIEPGHTAAELFNRIEALARETEERAVVILDGVNEGRRREWREALTSLQALITERPNIGLIVTCRTPFESIAIAQSDLEKFHKVRHLGFDDQEFDAQAAFFQYYSLPLPEVPLLDREFSRPLTLKLICQSLQNLTGKKLAQGFAGVASGQKGMTYILESFVNGIGKPIELEFGLKAMGCWRLLKGNDQISDRRLAGFAPCMAASLRGYVRPSEADRIIAANYPALRPSQRKQLLESLRTNGLIDEDVVWYSSSSGFRSRVVYRLPYQRFSDHLVARHLLKAHLDVSSVAAIKRSFTAMSPLARIFRISSRYQRAYAEPGWAQALITEFPERVGKRLPRKQRELYFVLPKQAQDLNAYFDPFIEGMFWRDPAAFTEGTRAIVNQYLNASSRAWERMVDALAAVSTKPMHPYHAKRLYDYLARQSMPDRDLQWSEFLRRRHASPTIHRLLTWAGNLNAANMTRRSATELVVLLSLVLTTVNRSDRDLATKALVLIGETFPEALFTHVVTSLGFNDPYVPERMLAAAYGVTLSLVDSHAAATFRPLLGVFAKTIYRKMFGPNARYATCHALTRDYALGIIHMAQRANCVTLPKSASLNLSPPFPNAPLIFLSNGTPDSAVKQAIGHAIHMDFGNYTIGRLIPNRANYDDKNPDYIRTRAKIERRMFDLGYREGRFKNIDSEIGNASWNARDDKKVDRYGKKYSWIAYFEMWGEREAVKKLPDWRLGERTSDCGVDPSFPKRPPSWAPPLPDLFGDPSATTEAWVEGGFTPKWSQLLVVPEINGHSGEWVLVEGYVNGVDESHDRELFAFLRGIFISRKDVQKFRKKFLAIEYPGNSTIPEAATEYYLYAGEAGRRRNFARHLYQRNGRYRRQVRETFDKYVRVRPETTSTTTAHAEFISSEGRATASLLVELLGPIPKMRHIPGVRIELPTIQFGWESYHSSQNDFSGFDFPSPSLIQRLGLASKNREIDFYDSMGKPGTLYRESGNAWKGDRHSLFYVRADLLRRYLRETRQVLVWCNWGERNWLKKMEGHDVIRLPARQRIYQAYSHIHRSFSQWSANDSKVD